jgi:hypothetical protein
MPVLQVADDFSLSELRLPAKRHALVSIECKATSIIILHNLGT